MNEDRRLKYPLELIKLGITFLKNTNLKRNYVDDPYRSLIVYCIQDMKNGKWLPLNRDYKPLGLERKGWAKYEDYTFLHIDKNEINFDLLWDNDPGYYVFSDLTYPRKKNIDRYIQIIGQTFFGLHSPLYFEKAWIHKNNIMYKTDWERNVSRLIKD